MATEEFLKKHRAGLVVPPAEQKKFLEQLRGRLPEEVFLEGNDFTLEKKLGSGSYGVVHLAKLNKQQVAAKEICCQKKNIKRIKREITFLSSLKHPHVVSFIGLVVKHKQELYIIQEYMANRDLENFIDETFRKTKKGPFKKPQQIQDIFPFGHRLSLVMQVARGLEYLHCSDVVHRDIKPGNVLLNNNKIDAKICDFGLSKRMSRSGTKRKNSAVGTPAYAPPEVHDDVEIRPELSPEVDMFSFGVLAFEVLCAKRWKERLKSIEDSFKHTSMKALTKIIQQEGDHDDLIDLLTECIDPQAGKRPNSSHVKHFMECHFEKYSKAVPAALDFLPTDCKDIHTRAYGKLDENGNWVGTSFGKERKTRRAEKRKRKAEKKATGENGEKEEEDEDRSDEEDEDEDDDEDENEEEKEEKEEKKEKKEKEEEKKEEKEE
eukprot:CAMPEP_0201515046 /NCGR_PEP_ID=MMETSP0161_2-20130828/6712_1 /ASSEMBLY_ACC=CAM_ASM_000251 /TAXON_ID=180227 /ORGANISM="Neoparamoeba aestuarina, Strain SoJaBio B1-5/56/2" /LENGTH=433 /DNA_ID=CAMNT_0047911755 /DNA_START=1003 /DNA_END=2304 /DNA_ORIENTATION=-